ncbi:hypothetical protein [Streptomyces sp. Tu 6176]|uniref:hypothetical protein n=1 Tax=Streptomyces sp. Tu 6176 TaxID=1470557 RepID=UPI000A8DDB62|nr:hypothetical protein [Streptomyces sp. Tu 6176]
MTQVQERHKRAPQFELRCGGLHVTVQRFPPWLLTLLTAATGSGIAWVAHR